LTTSNSPLGEFSIADFSLKLNGDSGSSRSVRIISIALTCGEIVGGISVSVEIGSGVNVDGMGDDVVDGEMGGEVTAGAHPLIKAVGNASARNIDTTDFFMLLSLLKSLYKTALDRVLALFWRQDDLSIIKPGHRT
jgi:hypothetical protein